MSTTEETLCGHKITFSCSSRLKFRKIDVVWHQWEKVESANYPNLKKKSIDKIKYMGPLSTLLTKYIESKSLKDQIDVTVDYVNKKQKTMF